MTNLDPPSPENQFYTEHITLLLESYLRLLKRPLVIPTAELSLGQQVYEANFALLSHNTLGDPLFTYANQRALKLFEYSWCELIGLPSRFSAEPLLREDRDKLLAEVIANGFIENYSGVRITKNGKRFYIEQAVVWNIYDHHQNYYGQAACFDCQPYEG